MNKETLNKAVELDEEICHIKGMLKNEILYIWNGVYRQHAGHGYFRHLSHQHDVSQRVSHILRIFFLKPTHMIAFRRMYNRSPQ